jgi:hypothetical protein
MDINLPDMLGTEVARIIREMEKDFQLSTETNITAVSVEGKTNVKSEGLFNCYCKMLYNFSGEAC